jgi:hypothetical protein
VVAMTEDKMNYQEQIQTTVSATFAAPGYELDKPML